MPDTLLATFRMGFPGIHWSAVNDVVEGHVNAGEICDVAQLLRDNAWRLGTIVASERKECLELRYCFYATRHPGWAQISVLLDAQTRVVPSITPISIAADWFEREIEDLFSIRFEGHPRLGDFVLHDNQWAENTGLMRPAVRASDEIAEQRRDWRPKRVLEEVGAFVMPVGPIYSAEAESALFLLETVGEDVVRAVPRLFYKYRAIEKLAEGTSSDDALLLAERCAGTSAIGNGLGYCRAVERAAGIDPPARALVLRAFCAELERIRHHVTSIRAICESTSLSVAASQMLWLEEQLLRITGELCGHRYFFGVLAVGGLLRDIDDVALDRAVAAVRALSGTIERMNDALQHSSSFLDRLEGVGVVDEKATRTFELVGPFARAAGVSTDMRIIQPYEPYQDLEFAVPTETEGDGYARLRVLFSEIGESQRILEKLDARIPSGGFRNTAPLREGSALGWTEGPRGASVHWVRVDRTGTIERYRMTPPSFRNWHGFHVATEGFAFQDFPIVLATLDLSVAENDR